MPLQQGLSDGLPSLRVDHNVPVRQQGPHEPVCVETAMTSSVVDNQLLGRLHRTLSAAISSDPYQGTFGSGFGETKCFILIFMLKSLLLQGGPKKSVFSVLLITTGEPNELQKMYNYVEKAEVISFLQIVVYFL